MAISIERGHSTEILMIDAIVAVCAVVGAALGVYNFLHERRQEKVKLRVLPKAAYRIPDRGHGGGFLHTSDGLDHGKLPMFLCIEVVNLSTFPVVIDEIGLLRRHGEERMAVPNPKFFGNEEWPRHLQARESMTGYLDTRGLFMRASGEIVVEAYARTQCGSQGTGTTDALKEFADLLRKAPRRETSSSLA